MSARGLLVASMVWVCATGAAPAWAGEARIEMSLAPDGRLQLRYEPPAGVRQLAFLDGGAGHTSFRGQHLQPADDCSALSPQAVIVRDRPGCVAARFVAAPTLLARPRTYEAAQAVGPGSVLAHTGFYVAAVAGHALRWDWLPPEGGYVLHNGGVQRHTVTQSWTAEEVDSALTRPPGAGMSALAGHQYVLLGRAPVETSGDTTLVRDPALDSARVAVVRRVLQQSVAALTQAFGAGPGGPVAVVVTAADLPGFHGDTTDGRMMRLRLQRVQPPGAQSDTTWLARFVAHEAVHWWNAGVFQTDHDQPWLHEGHADWAALLLLRAAHTIDERRLAQEIQAAINRCQRAAGERPAAAALRQEPYACGLVLMAMAQAQRHARRDDGAGISPLVALAGLHRGTARMDIDRYVAWADGGQAGAGTQTLLRNERMPFAAALADRLAALGLAQSVAVDALGTALPQDLRLAMARALMIAVMRADCAGQVDFNLAPDRLVLGTRASCKTLPSGDTVLRLQGYPLLAEPWAAWQAVRDACAAAVPVSVNYERAGPGQLPCPKPWPALPQERLWVVEADALPRWGLRFE